MAMIYLGVIFLVVGVLFVRFQAFEGVVVVEHGRTERWAVQPAASGRFSFTAHRNMPVEVIGFDNARAVMRVLGATEPFDAAPLPYRLHLTDVDVLERPPDGHMLEIHAPDQMRAVEAIPGTVVEIPEGQLKVGARQRWTGLLRDGRGTPMAAITAQVGEEQWTPAIFVSTEAVMRPWRGLAIALHFFDAEAAARAAFPEHMPELPVARWGVVEEERVHWFDGLVPGTGVTTTDGTEYMLLELDEGEGSETITVGRRDASGARRIMVKANSASDDGDVRFELWRDDVIVLLHAWRDGAALGRSYTPEEGAVGEVVLLAEGDVLDISDTLAPVRIRLEQLMRGAIAVTGEESGIMALTVETPNGMRRLREGESVQIEETRIRYRRKPQPPIVRYHLRALYEKDGEVVAFALEPGACRRVGLWRFCNDQPHAAGDAIALLTARRVAGTPSRLIGALLFVLGALGVCVLRFADWRGDEAVFDGDAPSWTHIDRTVQASPPNEDDAD